MKIVKFYLKSTFCSSSLFADFTICLPLTTYVSHFNLTEWKVHQLTNFRISSHIKKQEIVTKWGHVFSFWGYTVVSVKNFDKSHQVGIPTFFIKINCPSTQKKSNLVVPLLCNGIDLIAGSDFSMRLLHIQWQIRYYKKNKPKLSKSMCKPLI